MTATSDFEELPDELLMLILGQLDPVSLSRVKEWNHYWKSFVEDNAAELWRSVLVSWCGVNAAYDVDLRKVWSSFQPPDVPDFEENLCLRFHDMYKKFGSTGYRMVRIFARLFEWVARLPRGAPGYHFLPPVLDEFPPDKTPPIELRALYSLTGGQMPGWLSRYLSGEPRDEHLPGDEPGIFGFSDIYDTPMSMGLMPWVFHDDDVMSGSTKRGIYAIGANFCVGRGQTPFEQETLCVNQQHLLFYKLNCWPGIVEAAVPDRCMNRGPPLSEIPRDKVHHAEVEDEVAALGYPVNPVYPLVHWLESYVEQLENGNYTHRRMHRPDAQLSRDNDVLPEDESDLHLIRFPTKPPGGQTLVSSCGIEIKVSVSPQLSLSPGPGVLVWGYECTMRLLSVEEQAAHLGGERKLAERGGPLRRVQLTRRYWRITSPDEFPEEVEGPGVIGHHPILHAGGSPFSYCSLTHVDISSYNGLPASLIGESNWMEGYFTFEEHVDDPSRSQPMRTVRANVPRFHLAFPDVLL